MTDYTEIKLILVGDGGVGKSTFTKRHLTGEFEERYIATIGVDVQPLTFNTTKGHVCFATWDTAGQEKLGPLRDCYYLRSHCAIVMFDVTSRTTFNNVPMWIKDVKMICPHIPIVLCGNKVDLRYRKVTPVEIRRFLRNQPGLQYYEISAKSNYHIEKMFLYLARQLLGKDLEFVQQAAIEPPTVDWTLYDF